ncbi:hypothetical protein BDP81DRAFT_184328 [Colletotrichum phormii]|uniref:Uncharacterized protein n=1 Tax=Colletotrichum phormii TaxID=359342 RepID=A0AAJ0EIB4_9PEZI|nr:uncharacterized protein BDP81DRAFT_184328 [Colletotrichum phormii]KAK1639834.1 hypothetical protein BDP81DRAFT_184328 [Colletotrichum phormii]
MWHCATIYCSDEHTLARRHTSSRQTLIHNIGSLFSMAPAKTTPNQERLRPGTSNMLRRSKALVFKHKHASRNSTTVASASCATRPASTSQACNRSSKFRLAHHFTGRLGTPCGGAQAKPIVGQPAAVCLGHTRTRPAVSATHRTRVTRQWLVWQVRGLTGRLPRYVAINTWSSWTHHLGTGISHALHQPCLLFFLYCLFMLIPPPPPLCCGPPRWPSYYLSHGVCSFMSINGSTFGLLGAAWHHSTFSQDFASALSGTSAWEQHFAHTRLRIS